MRKFNKHDEFLRAKLDKFIESDVLLEDAEWPFMAVGTIEDYLKIREKFPDSEWFRAGQCATDCAELVPKLQELGQSFPSTFINRLNAKDATVHDDMSRWLLSYIAYLETEGKPPAGIRNGHLYSDSDVNFLVTLILERAVYAGEIPNSLIYLIGIRLVGLGANFRSDFQFRRFAMDVFSAVKDLMASSETVSARAVAKKMGIAVTSITRNRERLRRYWEMESDQSGQYWLFSPPFTEAEGEPVKFPF